MKNDLISRSALIAEYDRVHVGPPGGARKLMEDAPAVFVQEWIPVSERLPEKGRDYLCLCNVNGHVDYSFCMVLRYYLFDKRPHFQHEGIQGLRVTHWMSIPEPPKGACVHET